MIDYLIVGSGLAEFPLLKLHWVTVESIFVVDDDSQTSSKIAGGLYLLF
jgi:hypothetical protein